MKSTLITTLALFIFLFAGTTIAATNDLSANGYQSIQSDLICAEEKKDKKDEKKDGDEEPECD